MTIKHRNVRKKCAWNHGIALHGLSGNALWGTDLELGPG